MLLATGVIKNKNLACLFVGLFFFGMPKLFAFEGWADILAMIRTRAVSGCCDSDSNFSFPLKDLTRMSRQAEASIADLQGLSLNERVRLVRKIYDMFRSYYVFEFFLERAFRLPSQDDFFRASLMLGAMSLERWEAYRTTILYEELRAQAALSKRNASSYAASMIENRLDLFLRRSLGIERS